MREEADRYCALIERASSFDRDEFAAELAASLVAVMSAAAELPDLEPGPAELPNGPSHDEWRERFAAVQKTLGEWDGYWTTQVPYGDGAEDAVMLPVADDLADVWRDLKRGLVALEGGARSTDVTWEWRFGFYSHWGRHATEALRALHARLAQDGGPRGARPDGP